MSNYCTLEDLKTELGITDNDKNANLEFLIDVASRQVENICKRVFYYDGAVVELHAVNNYPRLILDRTPVGAITSIEDTADDPDTVVSTEYYELEDAGAGLIWLDSILVDTVYRFSGIQQPVAARKTRYKVTYSAGYETPNQTGTGAPALPAPVRYATIKLASAMYSRVGVDPRVQREHLLEASVWYSDTQFDREIKSILRPYIKPVMV